MTKLLTCAKWLEATTKEILRILNGNFIVCLSLQGLNFIIILLLRETRYFNTGFFMFITFSSFFEKRFDSMINDRTFTYRITIKIKTMNTLKECFKKSSAEVRAYLFTLANQEQPILVIGIKGDYITTVRDLRHELFTDSIQSADAGIIRIENLPIETQVKESYFGS